MSEPLALSLGQKFELERMSRAIDATADPQVLRGWPSSCCRLGTAKRPPPNGSCASSWGLPLDFQPLLRHPVATPKVTSPLGPGPTGSTSFEGASGFRAFLASPNLRGSRTPERVRHSGEG